MKGKYYTRSVRIEEYDTVTGELKRIELVVSQRKEYDLYMKLYLTNKKQFRKLNGTERDVLNELVERVSFNNYEVSISKGLCEIIAKELDLKTYRSVDNAIDRLCEYQFLFEIRSNYYYINPVYCWKGNEKEREQALKVIKEELALQIKIIDLQIKKDE